MTKPTPNQIPSDRAFPAYIPMDDYIETDVLESLHSHVVEGINRVKSTNESGRFRNVLRMRQSEPLFPGSRTIHLTAKPGPQDYVSVLTDVDDYKLTKHARTFDRLTDFIYSLPFEAIGRAFIIWDDAGVGTPAHLDHTRAEWMPEFIWFRTSKDRRLYMCLDEDDKLFVESSAVWFDTSNQFHGVEGVEGLTFSVRVDGRFDPLLRRAIAADFPYMHDRFADDGGRPTIPGPRGT